MLAENVSSACPQLVVKQGRASDNKRQSSAAYTACVVSCIYRNAAMQFLTHTSADPHRHSIKKARCYIVITCAQTHWVKG